MPIEPDLNGLRINRDARGTATSKPLLRIIILALVIGSVAIAAFVVINRSNRATPVQVVQVQSPVAATDAGDQVILSATGYIIAAHKIEVASKVVGRVAVINVDKGDKVQVGQVLVRLEDDEYRAQVAQQEGQIVNLEARLLELQNGSRPEEIEKARADVNEAKANLVNAKASLDRTQKLAAEGIFARQNLDDAQGKYDSEQAKVASLERTLELAVLGTRKEQLAQIRGQIAQAKGALAYAQTQLNDTVIKAPVSGTILDRNVEKGEFVTNGFVGEKGAKGYLVTMADLNNLQVELDISQNDFPKLGPKQKGLVTTDAYPDRKYPGFIEQVSPEADRAKATVQVKVRVEHPDSYLRPDMNATVAFINANQAERASNDRPIIVVPEAAIQNGGVFLVLHGRARKRSVTIGGKSQKGVLITNGLVGGEELIVGAPATLKDGSTVEAK